VTTPKRTEAGSGPMPGGGEIGGTRPTDHAHSRAREALDAICERLREGTPINHACALEGVPRRSFYDLMEASEESRLAVDAARAYGAEQYRRDLVDIVTTGGKSERSNGNVLLHLMERLYPDEYRPAPQRVENSGPDGGAQRHEVAVTIEQASAGARGEEP
jgi:hypothetical protein